jgi:hypothetical protein
MPDAVSAETRSGAHEATTWMVIMPKSAACHQTTGDRVAGDFAIIEVLFGASCPEFVRKWWNWQTHHRNHLIRAFSVSSGQSVK